MEQVIGVQTLRTDLLLALQTEEDEVLIMNRTFVLIVEIGWQLSNRLCHFLRGCLQLLLHLYLVDDLTACILRLSCFT